jgi:hypothetical protein
MVQCIGVGLSAPEPCWYTLGEDNIRVGELEVDAEPESLCQVAATQARFVHTSTPALAWRVCPSFDMGWRPFLDALWRGRGTLTERHCDVEVEVEAAIVLCR